jgi:hypothetical protein
MACNPNLVSWIFLGVKLVKSLPTMFMDMDSQHQLFTSNFELGHKQIWGIV